MALTKAQRHPLPSALVRSPRKAQETYIHTLESAESTHDDDGEATGGVDASSSNAHLMDVARRLDVSGRPKMSRFELVTAIDKANRLSARSLRYDRS
jgi:hypothetical protein